MKLQSQINVIPFIDIMLVLLAVVLTTASFVSEGRIPVRLPSAAHADTQVVPRQLTIAIKTDGALFLDEQPVSLEALAVRLEGIEDRTTKISLRVDQTAAFVHFVDVVDLLKARALNDVSIIAHREGG